jgi:cysteinyl-tRNA synthetase, unknown class
MKKSLLLLSIVPFLCCFNNNENKEYNPLPTNMDFKQEMRDFVISISNYAKNINPRFIIIPQNGQELVVQNGDKKWVPETVYLNAIDGVGREDLLYGYKNDNQATPSNESGYMISLLDICKQSGLKVLVTDYCSDHSKMDNSYLQNELKGYISFAAPSRGLDVIPDYPAIPHQLNNDTISSLKKAKNFLYLINPGKYSSKQSFIASVKQTNYDLLIMDMYFNEEPFSKKEIDALKKKKSGEKRLVISYLSIGEAENYRYYWHDEWNTKRPTWLDKENPEWKGNFKVRYWDKEWQAFIYGNNNSYLQKILDAGFDGAYLDIIDAFEYFEDMAAK